MTRKPMNSETERKDVYSRVTERIISDLEKGVRTWMKPWSAGNAEGKISMPLRRCGTPYRGVNVLMLWGEAIDKGYSSPIWMTYKQAEEVGGNVRKGEHGSLVVYANSVTRTETKPETGEELERSIPFMRGYTVFNAEQIEGLPEVYYHKFTFDKPAQDRLDAIEAYIGNTRANIQYRGGIASYSIATDTIKIPPYEAFKDRQSFYATTLHELTHWTRHESRLNRSFGRKSWGDEGYAAEELVAELSSAFLCAELDITPEVREDHAAYIGNWLKVLKNDKRAIFSAASHAQRAADYLNTLQPAKAMEQAA